MTSHEALRYSQTESEAPVAVETMLGLSASDPNATWPLFTAQNTTRFCILTMVRLPSLSFPLVNLPALLPPPSALSSLPLPPVPHCWGFPSSHSDVLPAGLLSLLATLSDTPVSAHACAHTLSVVPHASGLQRQSCMWWKAHMSSWEKWLTPY